MADDLNESFSFLLTLTALNIFLFIDEEKKKETEDSLQLPRMVGAHGMLIKAVISPRSRASTN